VALGSDQSGKVSKGENSMRDKNLSSQELVCKNKMLSFS